MYKTWDNVTNGLKLAWKHKILWVFALLAVAGGFNSNSNFNGSGGDSEDQSTKLNIEEMFKENLDSLNKGDSYNFNYTTDENAESAEEAGSKKVTPLFPIEEYKRIQDQNIQNTEEFNNRQLELKQQIEELSKDPVLGTADTTATDFPPEQKEDFDKQEEYNTKLFSTVLAYFFPHLLIIGLSFFTLILFALILGMIIRSWALGAMIQGTNNALTSETLNLRELGQAGIKNFVEIIKFNLFYSFLFLGLLLFFGGIPALLLLLGRTEVAALLAILFILALLIILVPVALSHGYGIRHLVLENRKFFEAFKLGLKTFKNNIGKTIKLIFANCLVQMILMIVIGIVVVTLIGIPALIFGGIAAFSDFSDFNPLLIVAAFIVGMPLFFIFIFGMSAVKGYMATYKEITWTTLFNFLIHEKVYGAPPPAGEVTQND